jgi:amino acid transporter
MDAEAFFASYLAIFVVIVFYIVVDSGRREIDWEHFNKTRAVYESYPKWRKFLSHLF